MATVEQTMMKVQRILTGSMGLQITLNKDEFAVRFSEVSTAVYLRVRDWGKDDDGEPRTLVLVYSPILRDVKATPALFEWVAREGGSRWFGHVEVHDNQEPGKVNLMMSHTLLGDYLDEKELESAMWGVLGAADEWDDQLQTRFGGKRWADA
jgi:hypothetical protein